MVNLRSLLLAALLGASGFLAYESLQSRLDSRQLLAYDDVLFDTDPGRALRIMVHGQGWEGRSLQHPLWAVLTYGPVSALERATRPFRPAADAEGFRRAASLRVGTVAGAVGAVLVFFMLVTLRLPKHDAALATVVYLAAFSQVVFSSIPEHWVISGSLIAAVFLATARLVVAERAPAFGLLVFASFVAGGLTLSNTALVLVPLVAATVAAGVDWQRAIQRAVLAGGAAGVLVAVGYGLQTVVTAAPPLEDLQRSPSWVLAHIERRPLVKALGFPFEVAASVGPVEVRFAPKEVTEPGLSPNRAVSLPDTAWGTVTPASVTLLALLLAGAVSCARLGPPWRAMGVAVLGVIGFNWILHSVWGGAQLFVYSQHWLVTVPILLGALSVALNAWRRFSGTAVLTLVALAVALNSARLSVQLLEGMRW